MVMMHTTSTTPEAHREAEQIIRNYGNELFADMQLKPNSKNSYVIPQLNTCPKVFRYRPQHKEVNATFLHKVIKACEANDLEDFYPLYYVLWHSSCESRWNYNSAGSSGYTYNNNAKRITKFFYELLKFNYPSIFDKEECPIGSLVSDSNEKYVANGPTTI